MQPVIVKVSTALTFLAFIFNILALWIPGWGEACVSNCLYHEVPNQYVCYYVGLFEYCGAVNGTENCADCTC
jgi:hypothetical protein